LPDGAARVAAGLACCAAFAELPLSRPNFRQVIKEAHVTGLIILAIIVGVIGYGIFLYNDLVSKRQLTSEGWSGIDVQLKRRTDLIPNLLETVKGYMGHERETLEAVTNARAAATAGANAGPEERAKLEGVLSGALGKLLAIAEAYPDLKANTTFLEFQEALQTVEDEIQLSRRYYNGAVRNMNVAVESFPQNVVANAFKFQQAEYFELENEAERAVPSVKF
jgi:LemA protein